MELGISGKTALVMGASRGIGRGVAAALAREGARVAMASRSRERLEAAAAEIDGADGRLLKRTPRTSIASPRCPEKSSRRWARSRSWSPTRAARRRAARSTTLSIEWEAVYRSLVLGPRVLIQAVHARNAGARLGADRQRRLQLDPRADPRPGAVELPPHGDRRPLQDPVTGGGRGGDHGQHGRHRPDPNRSADRAPRLGGARSKSGLASEVPAGRLGTPEEYGDLVAFLCSERAAYLTGAVIPLDGGLLRSV